MNSTRTQVNEAQKNIEPARQPEQAPAQHHEQGPMQVAAQAAYNRAQVGPNGLRPADLLALQRTVGNRMVQRMMAGRTQRWALQAKLTVGSEGDKYEHELDQMAEQVMRKTQPPTSEEEKATSSTSIKQSTD